MDDNRRKNIESLGMGKETPSQKTPPYLQRRSEGTRRIEGGEETVVRAPVSSRPQRPAAPQGQRPVPQGQRPAPQGQRPAPQGQPVRRPASNPAGNAPHQGNGSTPLRPRPAPSPERQGDGQPPVRTAHPTTVQNPANGGADAPTPIVRRGTAKAPQSEEPSYRQRRAIEDKSKVKTPSLSPEDNLPPSVYGEPSPAKPEKKKPAKKEDNKNSKAGAAEEGASMMMAIVKAIAYMVVVLVVAVFISIFVIRVGNDVFAFVKSDEAVDVTIPEDADIGDVADVLADNGIINYPGIFKMYASLKKDKGPFVAGDYTISPSMSYDELRRAFKEQVVTGTVWITIPEGYTTDEIIDLMVENGIGEREKYIDVINNHDFDYWFIDELENSQLKDGRVYRLEGYLFPDTYEFYKASSEETVINRLLARFDEVFVEDYKTKAKELGYTVDEILTIASLVEKEAGGAGDYMYVSSVFHNRLNNPTYYPRLESDATTVYAIQVSTGKRPDTVTPEDNKFEHPYNTYINEGLTPGPITNPSASAIRYALYPAKTGYYYFITDNAGKVYYGTGITEHKQNIEKVKQINEQLEG